MKTAISVPDEVFHRVTRLAQRHEMNRSQFFAAAAERYADELEADDLTAAINAVVDVVNSDGSTAFAVEAGRRLLSANDEEW